MSVLQWVLLLARRVGPDTVEAVRRYGPQIAANPQVAAAAKQLVAGVSKAQQARSPVVRLRRTIAVVQAKAGQVEATAADDAGRQQARDWSRRADALVLAVDLLEVQRGGARRRSVQTVSAEVDALMAEVLTTLVAGRDSATPSADTAPGP
ncbi:MAG TPA: hypothetical protein VFJ97_07780 [Dermatophilaceae bacterium]|nr:hypothetical protein [Dermatophilaceae bacterium]